MSPRNKIFELLDKYLSRPVPVKKIEVKATTITRLGKRIKRSSFSREDRAYRKNGIELRQKIVSFYKSNGRWPKRTSESKKESVLGTRFENLICKENPQFDKNLRRIVMATGRKSNNKRKHDVQGFKKEILSFIEMNGRVPARYSNAKIQGEGALHAKLSYYTDVKSDMTFLSEVYKRDACHKSSIPFRFRPLINKSLKVEEPLVRLPQYILKGK